MSLIRLEGAARNYTMGGEVVAALHPTDLVIEAGEFVVFLGPSGSGKTTLLNLIAGIDAPTTGRVVVNDVDIARLDRHTQVGYRRRTVGVVFQFHNLIPNLTARENVELAAELVGRRDQVDAALSAVELASRSSHFPHEMSGGEQQRVAIARALVKDPAIVLGDEPTGNLDAVTGKRVLQLFRDILGRGKCVLLVTHNAAAARVGTRVISMQGGRIRADEKILAPAAMNDIEW